MTQESIFGERIGYPKQRRVQPHDERALARDSAVAHNHRGGGALVVAAPAPRGPAGLQVVGVGVDLVRALPRRRRAGTAPHGGMDAPEDFCGEPRLHLWLPASALSGVRRSERAVTGPADAAGAA